MIIMESVKMNQTKVILVTLCGGVALAANDQKVLFYHPPPPMLATLFR